MTICPQCHYERTKRDEIINPAECPKCGIIYEKWKPSPAVEEESTKKVAEPVSGQSTHTAGSNLERKLLYILVIVAAIALLNSFVVPFLGKNIQKEKNEVANPMPPDSSNETAKQNQQNHTQEIKMQESSLTNIQQKEELSLSEIIRKNRYSVVVVKTATGIGSGFFISDQGYVVTNKHVLSDTSKAEIKTAAGNVYKINRIIAEDQDGDLVIASSDTPASEAFPVILTGNLPEVGEKIIVIGNPLGLEQTVSDGIVSAVRRNQKAVEFIQVTAPISAGNSGGPLLNMRGEVIGVAAFQYRQGQNLNFCVAAERLIDLKNGTLTAANQTTDGSFKTSQRRDVYCYADSNGQVSFVDWKTGMLVSRPDGSLDRGKFEKWVLEQIGGNPEAINPEREAREDVERDREELFKSVFPHKSMSDANLTNAEKEWLERRNNRHYVEVYNKAMSRRNEAVRKYNLMMREFDRFNNNRR